MRRSFQKPSTPAAASNFGAKCQKCLKEGHWTADCTNERVYKARPSRTALLFNPKLKLPEASLVKDDFVDEKQRNKSETTELAEEDVNEVPDADTFAQQLIEEVKQSDNLRSREADEREHYERFDSRRNHHRRRYRSRSYSPRQRSLSKSPRHRSKSPQPENIHRRNENEKKYTQYASDSDFSSDSD